VREAAALAAAAVGRPRPAAGPSPRRTPACRPRAGPSAALVAATCLREHRGTPQSPPVQAGIGRVRGARHPGLDRRSAREALQPYRGGPTTSGRPPPNASAHGLARRCRVAHCTGSPGPGRLEDETDRLAAAPWRRLGRPRAERSSSCSNPWPQRSGRPARSGAEPDGLPRAERAATWPSRGDPTLRGWSRRGYVGERGAPPGRAGRRRPDRRARTRSSTASRRRSRRRASGPGVRRPGQPAR